METDKKIGFYPSVFIILSWITVSYLYNDNRPKEKAVPKNRNGFEYLIDYLLLSNNKQS